MQDFYVYILKCSDGSYYIGHTDDLPRRIDAHTSGKCPGYTSTRLPVQLVYSATAESREAALIFERKIKRWSRQKKEALIAGNWGMVSELAKKEF
jgi:predicted GIY-YIG superfamily endonuclease